MKVGDQFSSYEDLEKSLSLYKASVYNEYWIRDARTLSNQRERFPDTVNQCNESLKYYHIRFSCVKGGRPFQSKNTKTARKCFTLKQDCQASIFLRLSKCQQFLTVTEIKDEHNHSSSKTYFTSLSQQRLKLPEPLKQETKQLMKFGANKKLVLDKIQSETGCKITLKDLTNLSKRKDKITFEDCVILLQKEYKCETVEVLIDDNGVFKGLYFQDNRMKKYFEAYPEILFADGTYCLVDIRTATYILMIEDGNGLSEIVAVCLLIDENEDAIIFFIESFKENNPSWENVKVVMSDKDRTERKVFQRSFPDAKLLICLFHVFQIFNREVSTKKMGITSDEVQKSKNYLQKLAYAKSEEEYNTIYTEMCENVPSIVKQYYEVNWKPIKEQWVKCFTFKNLCLENTTNNRLENLNSKLKSVISRYSPLEDFIKHIFAYISSSRTGKDVKLSQTLNKRLAKPLEPGSPNEMYSKLLTMFAYQKVEEQLTLIDSCKDFTSIDETKFLAPTSEGLLSVTPTDCECMFFNTNKLPCRHVFKCRQILSFNLFDENLCLQRWTRLYAEKVLEDGEEQKTDFSGNDHPTKVMIKKSSMNSPKCLTNHRKFRIVDEKCKTMAKLCSEVSTPVFWKRVDLIQTIIKLWTEGKDLLLNEHFDSLIANNNKDQCNEPTERTIPDHSVEIPTECTVTVDVQVHQCSIKETDKENDPKSVQEITQQKKKHEQSTEPQKNIKEGEADKITEKMQHSIGKENKKISKMQIINQIEDYTEEEYLEEEYLKENTQHKSDQIIDQLEDYIEEEYLEDEYLEEKFEKHLPLLKDVIMPPAVRKRGRPKGCGNTIIGLKRKK